MESLTRRPAAGRRREAVLEGVADRLRENIHADIASAIRSWPRIRVTG